MFVNIWYLFCKRIILYNCILITVVISASESRSQQLPDYLVLVHADSLQYSRVGNRTVTKVIGNVFFRKGSKELRCNRATYFHSSEFMLFHGNVEFQDSSRYLNADQVEYYAEPEREIAKGHVHLIVDQKEIFSNELTYLVYKEFMTAEGNVRFRDMENDVQLFGGKITYDRNSEAGHAEIDPKLVKLDSLGQTDITVQAITLNYDGQKKQAVALDSVTITRQDVIAYADTAQFFEPENKVDLNGSPRVVQLNDQLFAEDIELFFQENKLERAHLIKNSKMFSNLLIAGEPAKDEISGKEIWVDIENDSLRRIHVFDQATSIYHVIEEGKAQGVNQVMGDELVIYFDAGKVSQLEVMSKPGISKGQYNPVGITPKKMNWK